MDVMQKLVNVMIFKVFPRKTFKGVNGSGKRNWSLATDTGLIYFLQVKHQ
jgi:glutamine synthetase type III